MRMLADCACSRFLRNVFFALVKINDTTQRVALGFGLGVTLGIIPGTGPIAALVLAALLRLNRAAALAGSVLTNTWMSVVTFLAAVKIGAAVYNIEWQEIRARWFFLMGDFRWKDVFSLSFLKIIFPVLFGYLVISLCCGMAAYIVSFFALKIVRRR
ncbi:MAG: DUF2062 domain-containing protein [Candidatus Omnitrophota bacterium]